MSKGKNPKFIVQCSIFTVKLKSITLLHLENAHLIVNHLKTCVHVFLSLAWLEMKELNSRAESGSVPSTLTLGVWGFLNVYKLSRGGNCRNSNLPISPSPAIDGENLNSSIFGLLFVPSLFQRSVGRSVLRLAGKGCPTDSIFMTRPDQTRLFHRREYPVDSR